MALLADVTHFSEYDLQIAVAGLLDNIANFYKKLAWSHPPNEAKHKVQYRVKLKRAGMKTGEPDCVIYLEGGRTVFIELKLIKGSLSKEQKARHLELKALGFPVHAVFAGSPYEACKKVAHILADLGIREAIQLC